MFSYIAMTCLFGAVVAAPSDIGVLPVVTGSVSIPRYGFNYAVNDPHTGDNKAQSEVRDHGVVRGSYSLAEPDGTVRIVDYTADDVRGFNAVVKRVGSAVHPTTLVAAPIVAPVAPVVAAPAIGVGHGVGLASSWTGLGGHGIGLEGKWGGLGLGGLGLGHGIGIATPAIGLAGPGIGLGGHGLGLAGPGIGLGGHGLGLAGPGIGLGGHGLGLGGHGVGLGGWGLGGH